MRPTERSTITGRASLRPSAKRLTARAWNSSNAASSTPRIGGLRRVWLRGLEKVQKHYQPHVAGFNLALFLRKLLGHRSRRAGPA